MPQRLRALSLFSSGGIGDLAVQAAGYDIIASCELRADRHAVFSANYPKSAAFTGDIWELWEEVCESTARQLGPNELDLLYATPPCQGMSKNGRGKLLTAVRAGTKPARDVRNRLIIPTLMIAKRLRPKVVVFENVPEMRNTLISTTGTEVISIVDYIARELGPDYVGRAEVVEFADYGVPQRRQRLITVFSRTPAMKAWFRKFESFIPQATHSESPAFGRAPWRTVRDTIALLPSLDAAP